MKHQKKVKKQAKTAWVDVKSAGELKPGDRIRYSDFVGENIWIGDPESAYTMDETLRIVEPDGIRISNCAWTVAELLRPGVWASVQVLRPVPDCFMFKFNPDLAIDGDGCPTNGTRADWAAAGVAGFLEATGEPGGADVDSIRDLMANLLHLCDREGVDARYVIDRAVKDWEYEREV